MKIEVTQPEDEAIWPDVDDITGLSPQRSHVRTILSRAVRVYLVMVMGLALVMSILGVNPLVKNGLMPKALLVFVGLSALLALARSASEVADEEGWSWLNLGRAFVGTTVNRRFRK